jgi:multiple sugar transport system ATP-binding protein
VRPEDIGSQLAEQQAGAPRVQAQVDVIEPMGSETYVYLNTGETTFISRADPHQRFNVGEPADLAVFMDKAHFFDTETEKRIG